MRLPASRPGPLGALTVAHVLVVGEKQALSREAKACAPAWQNTAEALMTSHGSPYQLPRSSTESLTP